MKTVGKANRTAVELGGQLTIISAHLPHKSRKLGLRDGPGGNPRFHAEIRSRPDPGWRLQCELLLTDFHHVGESIPRAKTLTDTNDTLRARALHVVAELKPDGDENMD